jgi:lysophospholipase L1-like esterase
MRYERFVAVGDSCTEGIDDPHPDGTQYRGWADLVATRLAEDEPGFRYANLGVRGRRLDQIITEQIPSVAELKPDLVALFGGGNDVMSRGFDARTLRSRVDGAVRALTALAPAVAVFTISDISRRMPLALGMRRRLEVLNESIHDAADRYGAMAIDLWHDEAATDLRYFGADRLHLGEHGHRRLAAHLLGRLEVPFDRSWLEPLPGAPGSPGLWANAAWLRNEVLPVAFSRFRNRLVGRSPGDGRLPKRPELLPVLPAPATTGK